MNFRWFYHIYYMHKPHNIFGKNSIVLYALCTLTALSFLEIYVYNKTLDRRLFKRLFLRNGKLSTCACRGGVCPRV